jgi:hypothetical protein
MCSNGVSPFEGLEALGEIVGIDEVREVSAKLLMASVVVAPDGRFLERAVHAFDLSVGPRMVGLGQPVLDITLLADAIEHVDAVLRGWSIAMLRQVAELDAVVGDDGVHLRGIAPCRPVMQLDKCELRVAIDGNKHVQLALFGPHLGNIDVEVADRIDLELFLDSLSFDARQA